MKKVIERDYFDIYRKISASPESEKTAKIILKVVNNLESDFHAINTQITKSASIKNVMAIIEKEYPNPNLSLAYIAEKLDMNASSISREFKHKTNTKYIEYLSSVRIEKAKELLLQGMPVEDVIQRCGYFNVSSFKCAFKNHTNMRISLFLSENSAG